MRKLFSVLVAAVAVLGVASVASAAEAAAGNAHLDSSSLGLAVMGAALGMAIAAFGCGLGQGMGLKGACEGIARNPDAGQKIQVTLILGLAFVESLAIYALVVNLIILFANPFV
jgi:F-type H+-transporting ATPase subunit c